MTYLGDYTEDYATVNFKFTTRTTAGVPSTLGGTPVISVYKANGLTQSTAGVTLTVDFDTVTGLNNVLIDLSADVFYAVANDYHVVITTGTVNGVSVVGEVVAEFSIENRYMRGTDSAGLATELAKVPKSDGASTWNATALASINAEADTAITDSGIKTVVDGIQTDLDNATDGLGALKTLIDTVNTDLSNGTDGLGALKALIDTVDTVADAIKLVTDKFVFTVANQVDSNVQSINNVTITGDGSATPFDV